MTDRTTDPETVVPPAFDPTIPSIARIYDAALGGKDNFHADRQALITLNDVAPEALSLAVDNRAFLGRAVRHVARTAGIRQYLDIGAGLPAAENTHQIAQNILPEARVVYVDHDPVVLAHGQAILADNPNTTVVTADLRDPDTILGHPDAHRLLDFDQPVCLMLVSLLHCLPDDADPFGAAHALMAQLPRGSHLVVSHIASDDQKAARAFTDTILTMGTPWGRVRPPEEIEEIIDVGWQLVSPALDGTAPEAMVECSTWRHPHLAPAARPTQAHQRLWEHAGVAEKFA